MSDGWEDTCGASSESGAAVCALPPDHDHDGAHQTADGAWFSLPITEYSSGQPYDGLERRPVGSDGRPVRARGEGRS
jgi:hypothetical protein